MNVSEVELICGDTPVGYKQEIITGSNYVFDIDPNFTPLNLYNFWGNAATVNSFSECLHYVEGGFKPSIITIFELLQPVLFSAIFIEKANSAEAIPPPIKVMLAIFLDPTDFCINSLHFSSNFTRGLTDTPYLFRP